MSIDLGVVHVCCVANDNCTTLNLSDHPIEACSCGKIILNWSLFILTIAEIQFLLVKLHYILI